MAAPTVTMYTGSFCAYCERARALLKAKGVEWREIDIEADSASRAEMMARSGRRSVPQIFIGDTLVGGSEELKALDRAGRLDALLHPPAG